MGRGKGEAMAAPGLGPFRMIMFYTTEPGVEEGDRATLLNFLPVSVGLWTIDLAPEFLCVLFCFPETCDRPPALAS